MLPDHSLHGLFYIPNQSLLSVIGRPFVDWILVWWHGMVRLQKVARVWPLKEFCSGFSIQKGWWMLAVLAMVLDEGNLVARLQQTRSRSYTPNILSKPSIFSKASFLVYQPMDLRMNFFLIIGNPFSDTLITGKKKALNLGGFVVGVVRRP